MDTMKHDKFKRLAKARGDRMIKDLRLLRNLSNTSNYSYSSDEIKTIFKAIDYELRITKQSFYKNERREIKL